MKLPAAKSIVNRLLVIGAIGMLSACTTHYGAVYIESSPSGARVYDMEDGFYIGRTPINHVWQSKDAKRKFMNIRLQKKGYTDELSTFWLNLDSISANSARKAPQPLELQLEPASE